MNTEVTARHFDLSESLKLRTEERLNKLTRFFERILDARVVVNFEGNRYNAEATVTANGARLTSHAEGDTDRVALELVLDKLEGQIRRHKDRLIRNRRRGGSLSLPGEADLVEVAEEETMESFDEEDTRNVVSEEPGDFSISMSVAEACAELRASKREVLAFTNEVTARPAIVYRRRDGNLGVVDVRMD